MQKLKMSFILWLNYWTIFSVTVAKQLITLNFIYFLGVSFVNMPEISFSDCLYCRNYFKENSNLFLCCS